MPRFFIDFQDNQHLYLDGEGSDLATFRKAREQALAMLPESLRDSLHDREDYNVIVTVRNESGETLYVAKLVFQGEIMQEGELRPQGKQSR